jgi:large subunit ribosomal protein L21
MYAVIQTGGKQYRVAEGETVKVERLAGEPGAQVTFTDVLMVASGSDVTVGRPLVEGAKVTAEIVEQDRERKLVVFKYKRRKNYRKRGGHRQPYTALKITGITASSR